MDPAEFCAASLAAWRLAHLLHAEEGPWHAAARLRQALAARQLGVLDCFFCVSVWTALPAALLVSTRRRQFLVLWPALSAAAIMTERAAFPGTFAGLPEYPIPEYSIPVYSEDEETADVLRPD